MAYRDELARKAIHLCSIATPLLYQFVFTYPNGWRDSLLIMGALVVFAFVIEYLRHRNSSVAGPINQWFGNMLRPAEQRGGLSGATNVVLAGFLCILLFPKPIAVAVLLILSISDSLASLIGKKFGRRKFLQKSVEGSGAYFVSALVVTLVVLPYTLIADLFGAATATVVEAVKIRVAGFEVDDNLAAPLAAGTVMTLLSWLHLP